MRRAALQAQPSAGTNKGLSAFVRRRRSESCHGTTSAKANSPAITMARWTTSAPPLALACANYARRVSCRKKD
jgi:hypothetical protein